MLQEGKIISEVNACLIFKKFFSSIFLIMLQEGEIISECILDLKKIFSLQFLYIIIIIKVCTLQSRHSNCVLLY